MFNSTRWPLRALTAGVSLIVVACAAMQGGSSGGSMSFFVTSAGSGKGADLGGLAGADRHCQTLAGPAATDCCIASRRTEGQGRA